VLAFLLAQAQIHFEQHHSIVEESWWMLAFFLVQEQAHFEQHPSTVEQS
jgi:hypothetical protein